MTRFRLVLATVSLAAVLAAGCGGAQQASSSSGAVEITLTSQPDPPKTGETTFEAMVMEGDQPVTDADVSVELFMPAMPAMKMSEMKNSIPLKHEGGGRYRGAGNVMMAGTWDATVTVKRGGQEVGTRKVAISAQ
jgi:hypothetical protein